MHTFSRLGVAAGAAALSLTLAACGGGNSTSSSSTTSAAPTSSTASASVDATHNAADVSFAQNMIVHHQGAIQMAQVAEKQASTQQVKDLAKRIEAAQSPEIDEMTAWLKAWGEPVSASGSMGNMGSGAMGMM